MKIKMIRTFLAAAILGTAALSGTVQAGHYRTYDVTITNLTRAQAFTPILVASHRRNSHLLFNAGEPASKELAALAESGNTVPLNELLDKTRGVSKTETSEGLLDPGKSVTIQIKVRSRYDRLSMAAMLIPTNDAFFSFQNLYLPRGHRSVVKYSPAYDAGSEPNDELCVNIPGPVCGGEGASVGIDGEGYVHINGGIHGIGDLAPATYDWRNPVARVVIKRTR